MLDRHLIARTNPQANPINIVLWKDYRITVLQNRLFRIEKCANGKFRDKATQTVWFRNMPPQDFTVKETEKSLEIQTPYCSLLLYEQREDCRVIVDGEEKVICNEGNLLGTYRTLDGCNGNVFCGMDGIGKYIVSLENKDVVVISDLFKYCDFVHFGRVQFPSIERIDIGISLKRFHCAVSSCLIFSSAALMASSPKGSGCRSLMESSISMSG